MSAPEFFFLVAWQINRDCGPGAPYSRVSDHRALFERDVHARFPGYYAPEILFFEVEDPEADRLDFRIGWKVQMDMVPGAWHLPSDHELLIRHALSARGAYNPDVSVDILESAPEPAGWTPVYRVC